MKVKVWLRFSDPKSAIVLDMPASSATSSRWRRAYAEIFAKSQYNSGRNFDTFHVNIEVEEIYEYEVRVHMPGAVFEAVG